jgi:two-component system OmpR family response regulator
MDKELRTDGDRVLVVDDDPDIRELVITQLKREPYVVEATDSIEGVRRALAGGPIDVMVLDLNLPDGDGLSLCRDLRSEGFVNSIIMVTARDSAIDRVLGLELGADDYLTKPFEPRELLARIRNLLRRCRIDHIRRPPRARLAVFGPWSLDLLQRRLVAESGRLVILSSAEFRLLSKFVEAPSAVLSREELLPERHATVAFDRSLDLQISRLRNKLASEPGGQELILTVRNEGYVLASKVSFQ